VKLCATHLNTASLRHNTLNNKEKLVFSSIHRDATNLTQQPILKQGEKSSTGRIRTLFDSGKPYALLKYWSACAQTSGALFNFPPVSAKQPAAF